MFTKKIKFTMLIVLALTLAFSTVAMADAHSYTEDWDGRGTDSERCDYVGQEGRPATGWIHWVFSTKGDSTDASLVLGGTGSGTYAPGAPLNAEIWHFYTPFFDLDGLTATIYLFGGDPGPGGGLVISDYCPGDYEELTVSKTAKTSFDREHFWDIDKMVETENGYFKDGLPKIWLFTDGSGDETATWTVDVTYEGYEDSNFKVWGTITIENTGTLDAIVTDVEDLLDGMAIPTSCDELVPFPLAVGETQECTYEYYDYVEGYNVANVTTERGNTYGPASAPIVWGAPKTETNKTVTIEDCSDLFGCVELGKVTAPKDAKFTYTYDFAWADYGKALCGSYQYDNTATIVETGQSASASLKVNVQCFIYESAWAKGDDALAFCDNGFSNWGWTNPVKKGNSYIFDLWAGAGQCDTSKGTLVGTVSVTFTDADKGVVIVTYNVGAAFELVETHVYAGVDMFPKMRNGRFTVAPGQYTNNSPFKSNIKDVYVIAHAVVGLPDPNFGP
jgi:hypothetical protein